MCNHYRWRQIWRPNNPLKIAIRPPVGEVDDDDDRARDVFPDGIAPVLRATPEGDLEEVRMRWGFPRPPNVPGSGYVTNVRNTASSYWRPYLKPAQRCLVPASAFSEWSDSRPKRERWFGLTDDRPMWLAGIWRTWTGTRGTKAAPSEGEHLVYSFLTTDPNGVVRPIHGKAMPVVLTTDDEIAMWLHAPADLALALQRPLADREMTVLEAA